MDSIKIRGGNPLRGDVTISGAKNSALKLMVATLLTDEKLTFTRMPDLADTRFLSTLLGHLGTDIFRIGSEMTLQTACLARA